MNNQFDELAKNLAQSVTRRGALKRFSVGLAGIALASFGLANNSEAGTGRHQCINRCKQGCASQYPRNSVSWELCWTACAGGCPDGI